MPRRYTASKLVAMASYGQFALQFAAWPSIEYASHAEHHRIHCARPGVNLGGHDYGGRWMVRDVGGVSLRPVRGEKKGGAMWVCGGMV